MRGSKSNYKLLKLSERHPHPSPWWFRPPYHDREFSRRFYENYRAGSWPDGEKLRFFESMLEKGQSLLDIGCGGGEFGRAIAELGVRVTGIDVGPYPIECAREVALSNDLETNWIYGDVFKHEFDREGEFDCITLLGSQIQEFPPDELQMLFDRVKTLLKPGGHFITEAKRLTEDERKYSSYWFLPEHCLWTDHRALVLGENFYYPDDKVRVLREYAYEIKTGRLSIGGSTEKEYSPQDLSKIAAKSEMELIATNGSWDQPLYSVHSPYAISIFMHQREG